jgi:diguanylate cyclase (GGDEF)-like protein
MIPLCWREVHPSDQAEALRKALETWGYLLTGQSGAGLTLVMADRPHLRWLPAKATEVLWWVREGSPEEVSAVLGQRPGWVIRQESPLEAVREALSHLRQRQMGADGWLRQLLPLATLDELLRWVLLRAVRLAGASGGALWIRKGGTFYQRAGEGFPEAPLPVEEAGQLVRQGEAWLVHPLEQVGLLRLKDPTRGLDEALGWIREAEPLVLNAWNLELSQELHHKDDLTVAQNRRCLEAELPRYVRDAAARGESVALMFLDVDNLKQLNSEFGHPTGSKVLQSVAMEAQRLIRTQDRLYRYGGDEFCMLLPGALAHGAARLGERLIQCLSEAPLMLSALEVPISVSIGIAAFPAHAIGAEALLERADQALLEAKNAGKGRVVIAH